MLGAICGDIVGSVYEGNPIKTKEFPLFTDDNYFTDDTVMTIAIADALLSIGAYTEDNVKEAIINSMKKYGKKYDEVGYGGMFRRWLFLEDEGKAPYNSCGNGSAMRVSSVGWLFASIRETREIARWTAEVTHNHPEGIKGAEATAAVIYLARTGYSKQFIQEYIREEFYPLGETLEEIRPTYKFDATCQGTVPQAIQAFLEGKSFEDVIRNAISLGGDSDTLTCIAGSMAEAYYEIPEEIKERTKSYLPNEFIEIIDKFHKRLISSSCLPYPSHEEIDFDNLPKFKKKTEEEEVKQSINTDKIKKKKFNTFLDFLNFFVKDFKLK